jgi:hypothetical protein
LALQDSHAKCEFWRPGFEGKISGYWIRGKGAKARDIIEIEVEDQPAFKSLWLEIPNLLIGTLSDTTELSFLYPQRRNWSFPDNRMTFEVGTTIEGIRLKEIGDKIFTSAHLQCRMLRSWFDISGIKINHSEDDIGIYRINHVPVKPKKLFENSTYKAYLEVGYIIPMGLGGDSKINLEEWLTISLYFEERTNLRDVRSLLYLWTSALSFLRMTRVTGDGLVLRDGSAKYGHVYGDFTSGLVENKDNRIQLPQTIIEFASIRRRFAAIMDKWIKLAEEMHPMVDIYNLVHFRKTPNLEVDFILLTQAIDMFVHKYTKPEDINREQKKKIVKLIDRHCHYKLKPRLKERTHCLARRSLKDRVKELCRRFESVFKHHRIDIDLFSTNYSKCRNNLAHRDSLRSTGLEPAEQIVVVKISKMLLDLCIFRELGWRGRSLFELGVVNHHWNNIASTGGIQMLDYS